MKNAKDVLKEILEESKKVAYARIAIIKENENASSVEPTYTDFVNKLNTIRSGRSLKDETVAASMKQYYEKLSDVEKKALDSFLKGIMQILTGAIDKASKVPDPSEPPTNIKMSAPDNSMKKVSIKPNVIRVPDADNASKKSIDAASIAPIKVKSR